VKDGRLTQQQADRIKQHMRRDGGIPPLAGPPPRAFGFGPPGMGMGMGVGPGIGPGPLGVGLDTAADYLGLSQDQLAQRLRKGNSLADVAKAQGKSVDGLEQALVAAAKQRLDQAVADGDLTAKQRDELLQRLQSHVGELVRTSGPPGGPCGPGGPGFHGRRGFGPPPGWERGGGSSSSTAPGSFTAPAPTGGIA